MHWLRNTFVNRPNWTKALLLYGSIFHEIEFSFFQLCVSFSFRILIPMSSILQLQVASDSVALSECPSLSSLCYCNCQNTHRNYQINISSSFNCQLMASCASKAVTYHKRSLWDSLWIPHVAFVTVLEEVSTEGCNILWKEQSLQYFTSNSQCLILWRCPNLDGFITISYPLKIKLLADFLPTFRCKDLFCPNGSEYTTTLISFEVNFP